MERLEAEIVKLQELMSDPDLFTENPVKFQKATDALIERQARLDDAEEEWLELKVEIDKNIEAKVEEFNKTLQTKEKLGVKLKRPKS